MWPLRETVRCPTPSLALLGAALAASVSSLACKDSGEAAYQRAHAAYQSAVLAAAPPQAPVFDEVLTLLEAVLPGSVHFAQAQRLRLAVTSARQPLRAPLAIVKGEGSFPDEVVEQLRACRRLAELAGRDGGVTPQLRAALSACRERAEKLELERSHGSLADDTPEPHQRSEPPPRKGRRE